MPEPAAPQAANRGRWKRVFAVTIGVVALGAVIHFVGAAEVRAALARSLRWLPLLLALEGSRIPLEYWATRRMLGQDASRVPVSVLLRAQLLFYAMSIGAPGGRPVAEAGKAAVLGGIIGGARAGALGAAGQTMSFFTDALVALACAAAALKMTGPSAFTGVMCVLALASSGAAWLVTRAAQSTPPAWLLRRFPRLEPFALMFREAASRQRMLSLDVVSILLLSRLGQVAMFGVLFHAVGVATSVEHGLIGVALAMLGSVAGDAIPGQLGATDMVFALAAPALGESAATMASVALVFHAAQLLLVGAATVTLLTCFRNVAGPKTPSLTSGA